MYRKIALVGLLVGLCLCLSSCKGASETEDVAYVVAIGIDKAEQDKIKVTYRIEIPRAIGSMQGGGQELESGPELTNSVVASGLAEAYNLLASTVSRMANRSHMKAFIVSEELARSGISDILAPLVRYREYRGSVFICVVKGRAEEFLAKNRPQLDYLNTKQWESFMLLSNETSYYARTDIHEFYLRLKNPGASPYATYIALNPMNNKGKPAGERLPNQKADAYLAGDIPRAGSGNAAEFAGVAVFSDSKMVGLLDTRESRVLAILQNKLPRGFIIPRDPLVPGKQVNINVRNGSKPEIRAELVDGQEVIKIKVFLEASITAIPSGINYEQPEYRQKLEDELSSVVKQEIERFITHTQELGSDVFGFGYYLRPQFASYAELEKANLEELYRKAKAEVEVTTKIRRTGLMWRTSGFKNSLANPQ